MKKTTKLSRGHSISSYSTKMSIYDNETSNIYPDLNPTAPQEPQTYRLNKLSETESFFLEKIKFRGQNTKKETIQYNHRHCRHKPNYISSDYWRNLYCSICQWCWIARWHCLRRNLPSFFLWNTHHMKHF